jgi:uncharacterized protein YfeS|nr:hypothetical protein [Kofleriaceae bacterium]
MSDVDCSIDFPEDVGVFRHIVDESIDAIEWAMPRLSRIPGLNARSLPVALRAAASTIPATIEELREDLQTWRAERLLRDRAHSADDPWATLGLDWSEFHPQAREILDDPFFWDSVDPNAPVGNDTGADVLAQYREWRQKRKSPANATQMVDALLASWSVGDSGQTRDEAFIGLAFAQAMIDGRVTREVIECGILAVDNELAMNRNSHARQRSLERIRVKLVELRDSRQDPAHVP